MPRDANGNYVLPTGNPVQTDTLIQSSWANTTMQDLAAEMTDSLSRSGKGGFTGPLLIIDSQATVPGLAFTNEPTSGFKREALGDIRVQVLGSDRMRYRTGIAQPPEMQIDGAWEELVSKERLAIPTANNAMSGVDAETKVWFYSVIPAGWAAAPPDGNIRQLLAGTTVTVGGSDDPRNLSDSVSISISGNTGNTAITESQMPAHTHGFNVKFSDSGSSNDVKAGTGSTVGTRTTSTTGGGQGHNHSFSDSGNDSVSFTPRYAEGLIGVMSAP